MLHACDEIARLATQHTKQSMNIRHVTAKRQCSFGRCPGACQIAAPGQRHRGFELNSNRGVDLSGALHRTSCP